MKHWNEFYETTGHPAHYRRDEDRLVTLDPYETPFIVFFFTEPGQLDARLAEQTLPRGAVPTAVGTAAGIVGDIYGHEEAAQELWTFWYQLGVAERAGLALARAQAREREAARVGGRKETRTYEDNGIIPDDARQQFLIRENTVSAVAPFWSESVTYISASRLAEIRAERLAAAKAAKKR